MTMTDASTLTFLVAVMAAVIGYLLGSIPFGLILTRMAGLGDVRKIGSGNIGATNVLRTGNKKLAAATLLLDAFKATAAVVLARALWGYEAGLIAGFFAFLGHLFPVWLGFKGGKGVATYIGMLLGANAWMVLVFAAVWLGMAKIFKISSLAALVATAVVPVVLLAMSDFNTALVMTLMTAISWIKHKDNIKRLLAGTESKIGQKG